MNTHLKNMYKYRGLFVELVIKDIKLKYRNSVLGVLWSMLNPLLMMTVLSIIFMSLFKNNIENFPVYVLIGRILYQFFSEATNYAMDSINVNAQLIRKVYVPKYFFPISRVASSFLTIIVGFVPMFVVMLITGVPLKFVNLMAIFPLLYLLVISIGIGLLLSAVCVFFRDVKHFYSVVLMVVMYMTPIFYPASIIPESYMKIVLLNPLYPVVDIFRDNVLYGSTGSVEMHLMALIYALSYSVIGLLVFYKSQDRFIYHL